mgnify:FL=1
MLFLGETYIQIWERKDGSGEVSELMRRIAAKQAEDPKAKGKAQLKTQLKPVQRTM